MDLRLKASDLGLTLDPELEISEIERKNLEDAANKLCESIRREDVNVT